MLIKEKCRLTVSDPYGEVWIVNEIEQCVKFRISRRYQAGPGGCIPGWSMNVTNVNYGFVHLPAVTAMDEFVKTILTETLADNPGCKLDVYGTTFLRDGSELKQSDNAIM